MRGQRYPEGTLSRLVLVSPSPYIHVKDALPLPEGLPFFFTVEQPSKCLGVKKRLVFIKPNTFQFV